MLYAFKNGVSMFDEQTMNAMISAQSSSLIFDGTQVASSIGSGTTENNLSTSDHSASFVLTGQTTIGRIELEIKKYGVGADLIVEIRESTVSGTLKKTVKFPAKLFSTGNISLPIDLSGLISGRTYFIVLKKAGDSVNHLRWIGESGGAKHFNVFAKTIGTETLRHSIYGNGTNPWDNAKTIVEYNVDETIKHIWRWIPASDGTFMVCDKLVPQYSSDVLIGWVVE